LSWTCRAVIFRVKPRVYEEGAVSFTLLYYDGVCGLKRGTRMCQVGKGECKEDSAVARNFQEHPAFAAGVLR